MRFIPHQGEKESLEIIRNLASKYGLETEIIHSNDYTKPVDIHGEGYRMMEQVIAQTFPGLPSSPYVMTGATDAQFYSPVCDNCIRFAPVVFGPEQMKGMHGLNECIEYNCLPGAVLGQLIPFEMEGIDFCMTALFVIIFMDQWKKASSHIPALAGLTCGIVCLLIFGQSSFILPALLLVSGILFFAGRKEAAE